MSWLELAVYVSVVVSALSIGWAMTDRCQKRLRWLLVLAAYVALLGAFIWQPGGQALARGLPVTAPDGAYVSSDACRSCHPGEYSSWHTSYHRSMTELASQDTVLGPFDNVRLELHGESYELTRRNDEFWVSMPDLEGHSRRLERRVLMTTGSHHYQAYWVAGSRGNELLQVPFVYHLAERRFIPRRDAFLQPPDAPSAVIRWNSNCVQCHSVAGRPRHAVTTDRFDTRAVELGIACESCHGPAGEHVRKHKNPINRYRQRHAAGSDPSIINPASLEGSRGSEVCGQCHAYFVPLDEPKWWQSGYAEAYVAGERLDASRYVFAYQRDVGQKEGVLIEASLDSVFWPDGTIRVGGREYNGLIESACFTRGSGQKKLSCVSCHSMHRSAPDDQLTAGMAGNRACLQCHADFQVRLVEHTHHRAESPGSLCYNCHMPHTSYALFKGIRAHRVDSPSARNSLASGRPNACNLCHLDRTLGWTAEHLQRWYGAPKPPLDGVHTSTAASLNWMLSGDAAQRVILAAAMGRREAQLASGTDWQAPFLAQLLDDPYSAVRFVAGRSLATLPGFKDLRYDFIGSSAERQRAKRAVLGQWAASRVRARSELIFDAQGRLDTDRLQSLLVERDDRPVMISE